MLQIKLHKESVKVNQATPDNKLGLTFATYM